ncbi:MAG: hypothetical protein M5U09_16085 [Gammaproteobacteria bacterium]|nr:hypothetical protein [Gammaproteobacteria bacterium]
MIPQPHGRETGGETGVELRPGEPALGTDQGDAVPPAGRTGKRCRLRASGVGKPAAGRAGGLDANQSASVAGSSITGR